MPDDWFARVGGGLGLPVELVNALVMHALALNRDLLGLGRQLRG